VTQRQTIWVNRITQEIPESALRSAAQTLSSLRQRLETLQGKEPNYGKRRPH